MVITALFSQGEFHLMIECVQEYAENTLTEVSGSTYLVASVVSSVNQWLTDALDTGLEVICLPSLGR